MVPYERITAGKKLPEKGGKEMKGAILEKGETGYTYLKKLFLSTPRRTLTGSSQTVSAVPKAKPFIREYSSMTDMAGSPERS